MLEHAVRLIREAIEDVDGVCRRLAVTKRREILRAAIDKLEQALSQINAARKGDY